MSSSAQAVKNFGYMKHRMPISCPEASSEAFLKDLNRFIRLDRKAFEAQFSAVDSDGHSIMFYRDIQLRLYAKWNGVRSELGQTMINRSVDPEYTYSQINSMRERIIPKDKRKKR